MKRAAILAVLGILLGFAADCVVVYPTSGPPPHRVEVVPPRPGPGLAWVAGYWGWSGGSYVWISGRWVRPPRGKSWAPGHWEQRGHRWVWRKGRWR